MESKKVIGTRGAARLFHVHPRTIKRWIVEGLLPEPYRIGKKHIFWDEIELWAYTQAIDRKRSL